MPRRSSQTVEEGCPEFDRPGRTVAVLGAGGFFGQRLVFALLQTNVGEVRMFDIREPLRDAIPTDLAAVYDAKTTFIEGDIRNYSQVSRAVAGCATVFQVASYGMSGREMLQKKKIHEINVDGTKNVIRACKECFVPVLIYTSSYNVVFNGTAFDGACELTAPYAQLDSHHDEYSKTKTIAEQLVLDSSCTRDEGATNILHTCALRPAGIYGDGEERHFPRIISMVQRNLFQATIGGRESLVEWVYVDNLAHAHLLAEYNLHHVPHRDWCPINQYKFLEPLLEALGYDMPAMDCPGWVMFYVGYVIEWLHYLVSPIVDFQPLITRAEVLKVSVTHWFSPDRSRDILGYHPIVSAEEGSRRMVEYYKEIYGVRKRRAASNWRTQMSLWLILLCIIFGIYFVVYAE